ncbi:MAG: DNA topoisomerase IV subunit A [Candidatus Accumulibacter sp.]|jgi:topoisomerase-4 subunit A|nr:DNA topoisomerase IV subunit A [Accumulibacter sp.]
MNESLDLFDDAPPPQEEEASDSILLHESAARDYLEYAIAVVKGRALPDVRDGQKPVQRRVLYAMRELGLTAGAKPVKSARVVGDVIGKFHPHGDVSAYDAMVRIAQDFSLRYPLVDGQGNFGSRDGDSAAAMRYTEARLMPIAELLLGEIDEGAVDFQSNYDGAFNEPVFLPARLPFSLLNGASGIAVGMATEIPPHNLGEVARAAVALIENPRVSSEELLRFIPGPDYPGGGQIISAAAEIAAAYETGRGSLRVRARYLFEEMARGAWQLVVSALPPGVSTARVLSEIGAILNPQPRSGKKSVEQPAAQLKALFISQVERARDESDKDEDVRIVFEPLNSRIDRDEFAALLLAHTSLEINVPINLVAVGIDGRPCQKTLREMLDEWCRFRMGTVRRRSAYRLARVEDRIHIDEGRHIVFLNIDEVIRIIRASDDPKPRLIERFGLSARQADDILEIRLRQLARLEGFRIEQELQKLRAEKAELEKLLASDPRLRRLVVREIESDAAQYGDARRTLIEPASTITRQGTATVTDEPVTLIVSAKGWARARQGHGIKLSNIAYKDGDSPGSAWECRSIDALVILSTEGRAFTVPSAALPDGRGMGAPLASFIDLGGGKIAHVLAGRPEDEWLVAKSSGYGFICAFGDLLSRQKSGKTFLAMEDGAFILPPSRVGGKDHVAALSGDGRLLVFPLDQMKRLSGGKGVRIIGLKEGETLASALAVKGESVRIRGSFRNRSKETSSGTRHIGPRARRGATIGPIADPEIAEKDE